VFHSWPSLCRSQSGQIDGRPTDTQFCIASRLDQIANATVPEFLREQAGLWWWYPLLKHPEWLDMFTRASANPTTKANAPQFQEWVANYKPDSDYQGWMGYSEDRNKSGGGSSMTSRFITK
jgi:hypothetical protein